jgi:hypothetical protein
MTGTCPVPGEPRTVAFESYDNDKATGVNPHTGCEEGVLVPMCPTYGDYPSRVRDWAVAMASRHGDVAPAEILMEAIEVGSL